MQLRFTTKYDGIEPLLGLEHTGRTRIRFSVNAAPAARFEGGTAAVPARLQAMRRAALAGYPVGLSVAPIIPIPGWREAYDRLLSDARSALDGVPRLHLSVELITDRFTPASKRVLNDWYKGSSLDMDEATRRRKLTKFGSLKYVYPADLMRDMRAFFEGAVAAHHPNARILYWT